MIRYNDIAISLETRPLPKEQKQQEPKLRLINFVACKTVGEYNRNKRRIEKFCLAEKAKLAKTTRTGQSSKHTAQQEKPNIQASRKRKATTDEPGPSAKAFHQGMSTPINDEHLPNNATNSSINVSPISTKKLAGQRKLKKKSSGATQKGKRTSIKKATVSAARRTANTKLTKAKLAALKPSYAFHLGQSPVNIEELDKKSTTRIFKERSPGHAKPFIIATSSSAADFMLSTPKRSTVATIKKSPPLRNIRKSKAEATVKKLNVEKTIANISLSPTTDDSTHESKNNTPRSSTLSTLQTILLQIPHSASTQIAQLSGRISSSYHPTPKNPATPFTQLPSTRSLLVTHNPNDPNPRTGPQAHKNPNGTQTHTTLRKIALTRTPKTDRNLASSKRGGMWWATNSLCN